MIKFDESKITKRGRKPSSKTITKSKVVLKSTTNRRSNNEIPTSTFKNVSQYCLSCDEITTHIKSRKSNVLHCLNCEGAISF